MTEAVEFDVPSAGAPHLDGGDQVTDGPDAAAAAATPLIPAPGWTQDEAARVVGGLVANLTLAMYGMRWHAIPEPELWPALAGDPPNEFPLMGAGVAPVLDFLAPKGSPQAIGVSLTAGTSEIFAAMARRWEVINTAPPTARPTPAPAADPRAPAASSEAGFRYRGDQLRVLESDGALAGLGFE